MEKQTDILGYFGLGVSSLGAIASIVTNNVAFASVPLTVGVACNLISRNKLSHSLVAAYNQQEQAIDELQQQLENNHNQISEQLIENKTQLNNSLEKLKISVDGDLNQQKESSLKEFKSIYAQYQELNKVVDNLKNIENLSQNLQTLQVTDTQEAIQSTDSLAEFHYGKAISYEQLGNEEAALRDFSKAINADPSMARAYHKRGILYLNKQDKQKAVDDLRKAALLYFEQGDIESYQKAREMSRNVHELKNNNNNQFKQAINSSNLFS